MPYPIKKLGEICDISSGGSAPQGKKYFQNGEYPFFRTSDVGAVHLSDGICDVRDYLNDDGAKKLRLFKKGTILFPKSGASTFLNHRVVMGCDGYVSSHLATITADKNIYYKYLYFFLILVDAKNIAPNSSYPSLKISDIAKISIPIPPLSIQKKIVERVEKLMAKIDEAKKLRKEATADASALIPSALNKIFEEGKRKGWKEKSLGEICEIITGGTPRTSIKDFYGNEFLWAGPSDLDQGVFVIKTNKKLSKKGFRESGIRIIPKNSVMMSCIGYIGKLGIAGEEMATNQQINTFVPNLELLESKYLYYSLMYKTEEFKINSSQTTLPIINKTKCSNISIPLPPLPEQRKIVKYLDSLSEKVRKIKKLQSETERGLRLLEKAVLNSVFCE